MSEEREEGGYAQNCSLRDYFAGQALPRMLGLALQLEAMGKLPEDAVSLTAKMSYQVADAMLKERGR